MRTAAPTGMPTPMRAAAARLNTLGLREQLLDEVGGDHREREEPEHDARDPGQHLEDRLDGSCAASAWRTRRGRSREREADGRRDDHRDRGHDQRPEQEGRDIEDPSPREPADAGELREIDLGRGRLSASTRTGQDDEYRDHDRRGGRPGEEHHTDGALAALALRAAAGGEMLPPGRTGVACAMGPQDSQCRGRWGDEDSRTGRGLRGWPDPFAEERNYFAASQAARRLRERLGRRG